MVLRRLDFCVHKPPLKQLAQLENQPLSGMTCRSYSSCSDVSAQKDVKEAPLFKLHSQRSQLTPPVRIQSHEADHVASTRIYWRLQGGPFLRSSVVNLGE